MDRRNMSPQESCLGMDGLSGRGAAWRERRLLSYRNGTERSRGWFEGGGMGMADFVLLDGQMVGCTMVGVEEVHVLCDFHEEESI